VFRQDHLKTCPYEDIMCPNEQCQDSFPRKALSHHLQARCKFRVMACQFCKDKCVYKDIKVGWIISTLSFVDGFRVM